MSKKCLGMRISEVKVISLVLFIIGINIYACKENSNHEQNNKPVHRNERIVENSNSKKEIVYSPSFKIKNKSKLKVDLLFCQDDLNKVAKDKRKNFLYLPDYEGGVKLRKLKKNIQLLFYNKKLEVFKDTIQIVDNKSNINQFVNADYNSKNKVKKINSSIGELNINYSGNACDDTEHNQLVIKTSTGDLVIDYLLNVEIFLTDLDNDKKDEMYIVSFRSCSHELAILRIK